MLYYAPIIFTQAGFSSQRASFLASGISGIINLVFTIPAQLCVDKWGRKFPLIGGGIAIASCFLAIGSIYAVHGGKANGGVYLNGKSSQWAVIILIYMFIANFAWSWAVVSTQGYSVLTHETRLALKQGHKNICVRDSSYTPACEGMCIPASKLSFLPVEMNYLCVMTSLLIGSLTLRWH